MDSVTETVELTFVTPEGRLGGKVNAGGVFHEALEHLLPEELRVGRRITMRTSQSEPVYADMFIGETIDHFKTATFLLDSRPLNDKTGAWRNLGFDHVALAVADRQGARRFFADVLHMQLIREDSHQ